MNHTSRIIGLIAQETYFLFGSKQFWTDGLKLLTKQLTFSNVKFAFSELFNVFIVLGEKNRNFI